MQPSRRRFRGFTIIEMLVVIGVIALLVGLLFPALSGVRKRSLKTAELNNIRQLTIAWFSYSQTYGDAALPGFMDIGTQAKSVPGVQLGWGVTYEYPVAAPSGSKVIPPAPLYIDSADPAANIAGPYPWRVAKYTDFAGHLFLGHTDADDFFPAALVDRAEEIAYRPSFGYNAYYLGGWYTMHEVDPPGTTVPLHDFADVMMRDDPTDPNGTPRPVGVVARTLSNIINSEQMIVFCAAAELSKGTYPTSQLGTQPGLHYVTPRFLGPDPQWRNVDDGIQVIANTAAVPLPRHGKTIATSYADGHTSSVSFDDLTDMRHWINGAGGENATHTN